MSISSTSKCFCETMKRSLNEVEQTPPEYLLTDDCLYLIGIEQSIFRALEQSKPKKKKGLKRKVKELSGDLFNPRFFEAILNEFIEKKYIEFDGQYYSLNISS